MSIEDLINLFEDLLNTVKDNTEDQRIKDKVNSILLHISSACYTESDYVKQDLETIIKSNLL